MASGASARVACPSSGIPFPSWTDTRGRSSALRTQRLGSYSPVVDEDSELKTEDPGQRPQAESIRLVTSATAAWLAPMPHSGWQGVPSRQRQVPADADA